MQQQDLNSTNEITNNITTLLDFFQIDYREYATRVSISCPLHSSSKNESLSISLKDESLGIWHCWTAHCEEDIIEVNGNQEKRGKDIVGLLRSLLEIKHGKTFSRGQALKWYSQQFNVVFNNEKNENYDYIKLGRLLSKERSIKSTDITRSLIRSKLKIPAQYFLDRGFSKETLDKYDVGLCTTPKKEMSYRVVVPIYDDFHKNMVGCVGRSTNQQCEKCGMYHYKNCPANDLEKQWARKWVNSSGCNTGDYLYNYWYAKDQIVKTGNIILVEGQGDVWRLEEAGYHNVLGLFGSNLTDSQKILLDKLGAFNILICTDSDDAGEQGREKIKKKCERYYNLYDVYLPQKDVGDMNKEEIVRLFEPILEKL